jgi:hypothetical protein
MYVQSNTEVHSRNLCYCGKVILISVCVCVYRALECVFVPGRVGLYVCARACSHTYQHAIRMRHILLSFVVSMAHPYFSTLSHKRHDFRKKLADYKMRALVFSTTFI